MKLIEQVSLWCREGSADKVYEVDLYEVGTDKYVVNFRYGRRGATLKDGTKTASSVDRTNADKIFNALIAEKKKGGYQETGRFSATQQPIVTRTAPTVVKTNQYSDKKEFILAKLREASQPGFKDTKWPLSRIIWRVGELRISEAVPDLTKLAIKSDALQQYCICWALGRCGDRGATILLEQLYLAAASKDFVKRIALVSLLALADETKKNFLLDSIFQKLHPDMQAAVLSGKTESVHFAFNVGIAERKMTYEVLEHLYLLSEKYAYIRPVVVSSLQVLALQPGIFKYIRHIYKIAEFREDAEVFATIAYRFEKQNAYFRQSRWGGGAYAPGTWDWINDTKTEMNKNNSRLAFSNTTKEYFVRRSWRTLRTLGEDQQSESYAKAATAFLLQYSDIKDKTDPRQVNNTWYEWNSRSYKTRVTHYPAFANCLNLFSILYQNSSRYELKKNTKAWRFKTNSKPDTLSTQREEAFPEHWDKHPEYLAQLLTDSRCELVHEFAVKALRANPKLSEIADSKFAVKLLEKEYDVTVQLGLELVKQFYNPQNPDAELVSLIVKHPKQFVRELGKQWIEAQPEYFASQTFVFADLIINPYEDVWEWGRLLLSKVHLTEEQAQMLIVKTITELLELNPDDPQSNTIAEGAGYTLVTYFISLLQDVSLEVVQELLQHPVPMVQVLGAGILVKHVTPVTEFPSGLISSLINSSVPQVRGIGVQLFGKLPDSQLLASQDILFAFCTSPFAEIRQAIFPTIGKLAAQSPEFGVSFIKELIPVLQHKQEIEGLHEDLLMLIQQGLTAYLSSISSEDAWIMLGSRRGTTQRVGFLVIRHTISPSQLSVRDIIKMANHELLEVREYAWAIYTQQISRMKQEASEALRILDVKWSDSRQFGFDYFRQNFTADDWTPTLLVSVCDSTREDVQQFGKEVITRFFKTENGSDYLLQLSQHPSQNLQVFATNYLEQFATDSLEHLQKLELYFITVLSQVNRSGMAKTRIFNFLRQEALKNEQSAALVSKIIARQSATMAIDNKAACIRIMYDIRKSYPTIDLPLTIKETPVTQFVTSN
ncbi:WGR domain-containing protein [Cytophagaceae bacterium DM2B3-1]|uniref:WGR domain-containing protein n=1 Tax=Xanthocytophaga flava TaxID=3048013 RepID=A0ABT7CSX0_9BACT|nr:WGR domain-containing protein [Xanthocytophaga flavus]MDJ1495744.1 WGR domain-containing protein [Xanthocytophaga flavus]